MPNWVTNTIAIRKENKKYLINDNGDVDFNIICPRPEELDKTIAGGRVAECVLYYVFKTSKTKAEFFKRIKSEDKTIGFHCVDIKPRQTKKEIEKIILDSIGDNIEMYNDEFTNRNHPKHTPMEVGEWYYNVYKKYGYRDWYDWSIANWGCKWNACECNVWEDGDLICASFDTPWGTPYNFLMKLSTKCPFYLEWVEEQGYHGEILFDGESFREEYLNEIEYEEDEDGYITQVGEYYFDNTKDEVLDWKIAV